ncbi:SDR family NAD(P)-dependent oxidoreductase [Yinghuangia aomiensis]
MLGARRAEPLRELAATVAERTGRKVLAVPTDIADADACRARSAGRGGGTGSARSTRWSTWPPTIRPAAWRTSTATNSARAFDVNVLGVLEVSRAALPHMRAVGGGSIVQISTEAPRMKLPYMAAYASTKMAMEIASATMAREVGRDGIRVNVVVAGYTDNREAGRSYLESEARRRGMTAEEVRADFASSAALKRITQPEDIAEAVLVPRRRRGRAG